jgi:hypothetical protein
VRREAARDTGVLSGFRNTGFRDDCESVSERVLPLDRSSSIVRTHHMHRPPLDLLAYRWTERDDYPITCPKYVFSPTEDILYDMNHCRRQISAAGGARQVHLGAEAPIQSKVPAVASARYSLGSGRPASKLTEEVVLNVCTNCLNGRPAARSRHQADAQGPSRPDAVRCLWRVYKDR